MLPGIMPLIGKSGGWSGQNNITRAAWFDGAADYQTRTNGTVSNNKRCIRFFWVRRYETARQQAVMGGLTPGQGFMVQFLSDDTLQVFGNQNKTSARKFRDSEWYPLLVSIDTTDGTAGDRVKVWLGQEELTLSGTDWTLNDAVYGHQTGDVERLGVYHNGVGFFYYGNISIAQYLKLDGVSIQNGDYAVTDFTEAVTVGTNGVVVAPVSDASLVTICDAVGGDSYLLSSDIGDGTDDSANSNSFTPTSMSDAANGSVDTPSNPRPVWSHAGHISSNSYKSTVVEGGVRMEGGTNSQYHERLLSVPLPFDKDIYLEARLFSDDISVFGVRDLTENYTNAPGQNANSAVLINNSAGTRGTRSNNVDTNSRSADADGNILQIAWKGSTGELWLGRDDTWYGSGSPNPSTGTDPTYTMTIADESRFGVVGAVDTGDNLRLMREEDWTYTPPTGFVDLRAANLSAPVTQGVDEFHADELSGTGAEHARTGYGFDVGASIVKKTSATGDWHLVDENRGATLNIDLNNAVAEDTQAQGVKSFDSDGITLGTDTDYNDSGVTFISYAFHLSGAAGVSNTDGDITTTVDANASGCFSNGKFTGNATANQDIGHGLGVKPAFIFFKNRTDADAALGWFPGMDAEYLNLTNTSARSAGIIDGTNDDSTFRVDATTNVNGSGDDMLFMAFGQVPGVVMGGEYMGNGNADGPMIFTNFKPRWILTKSHNAGQEWLVYDTVREPENFNDVYLSIDSTAAEIDGGGANKPIDILANGFKIRTSSATLNTNGNRYSFLAIADVAAGENLPPIPGR